MSFHDLPFWIRMLTHWGICGFLVWIGFDNPDASFLILLAAAAAWFFCFHNEVEQGHW